MVGSRAGAGKVQDEPIASAVSKNKEGLKMNGGMPIIRIWEPLQVLPIAKTELI